MNHELHPLCTLFPRMAGAEFDALCADVKANGLRQPITLHNGMILDGGNRYAACVAAGVEPQFAEFSGDNPVAFVLSANLHRRHMTPGQQAAIVASAQDWGRAQKRGGDGSNQHRSKAATLPVSWTKPDTVATRAADSGASERTQRMADKVAREAPDLAKKVAHGVVSLPKAHEQVTGKVRKVAPAEMARQANADEAHGDFDPLAELEAAQKENEALHVRLRALEADDTKAELNKALLQRDHAVRQQSEAMEMAHKAKKREEWAARQLQRCGKLLGVSDPDQIAPAVERFIREHRKVAA